jgi:hypothetical protein
MLNGNFDKKRNSLILSFSARTKYQHHQCWHTKAHEKTDTALFTFTQNFSTEKPFSVGPNAGLKNKNSFSGLRQPDTHTMRQGVTHRKV